MLPIAHPGIHDPGTRSYGLNFGRLQIATAVLDSPKGPRLVIIETDRIIQWETFRLTRELRGRAVQIRRELRKAGWINQKKDSEPGRRSSFR